MDDIKLKQSYDNANILIAPHQISIDITNKCNLRCLHCYNFSGENCIIDNELTDDEFINFIESVSDFNLRNICFCGGEPLLRKKLLLKSANILKNKNCYNISIVTNGFLLDKETLDELINAGVNRIQVSLDGANSLSHDRMRNYEGAFEKAKRALELIVKEDIEFSVAFCPTSFNYKEFEEVFNYLKSFNKKCTLRVQPLMEMGRANKNLSEIIPSIEQYRQLVKKIYQLHNDEKVEIIWGDPIDHILRFSTMDIPYSMVSIRANGDIVLSPYLPLVVGNIKRYSLKDYWDSGLNKLWDYEVCKEVAKLLSSVDDMGHLQDKLELFKDDDIYIDLIDQDLDDLTLLNNGVSL